ncbi:MAG TPA: hypothetical protein VMO17_12545 [Terriglobia bacterium]|nr:hypothetical protein [Terriglobia bacterium]
MAFLDWLTGKIECPRCGTSGAKEVNGQITCPNPTCAYFVKTAGDRTPASTAALSPSAFSPPVNVPSGSLAIQYVDFRGHPRTFFGEPESARRVKNHISMKVAPKGARIVLARDRIQNLAEVESAFPQRIAPGQDWPTPRERQVMTYHKKRRTTSPLHASIRAKYPYW